MLENVPGLAKNRRSKELRRALKRMGYELNDDILNAVDYGVPQRRRRYILLAAQGKRIPFGHQTRRLRTVSEAFKKISPALAERDPLHNLPERRNAKVQALIRRIPRNGGSRADQGKRYQLKCHKKFCGFHDVYGRMAWNTPSPTITGGCCNPSKGRFLHPTKHRNITLREAALLQTFPPTYFFSIRRGKFPAAQMIGNALPPEFIRRHAKQIANLLRTSQ
jgi:DNA (cytosine-5)-methyltransferase 1